MSRKVKTVSFSLVNEYDQRLLEYAEERERGSFSQYVKRLIDLDIKRKQHSADWNQVAADSGRVPEDDGMFFADETTVDEDADAMGGFL